MKIVDTKGIMREFDVWQKVLIRGGYSLG